MSKNENAVSTKNAPLLADELEVKINTYSDQSFTVVVYWNARVAMAKLSARYGDNWSKSIKLLDKKSPNDPYYAICSIKVTDSDGTEIVREDVGESDDSPKNASTDAIKRAAMNFVPDAQALYTLPVLRIPVTKLGINVKGKENVKKEVRWKQFYVESISFADGASGTFVKAIQIADEETGNVVCEYTSKRTAITRKESGNLLELKKLITLSTVTEDELLARFKKGFRVNTLEEIADTDNLFESAKRWLESRKKPAAKASPARTASVNEQLKGRKKEA